MPGRDYGKFLTQTEPFSDPRRVRDQAGHTMPDKDTDPQDRGIQALLKDYPMPAVAATYFDHALVQATHEGSRRQRNRWMITGFGSAVAAGLALWMIGGFFLTSPDLPTADAAIPGITMTLAKPQTVNLIFATV